MSQAIITQFIDNLTGAFRADDANVAAKTAEAENVRRLQEFYRSITRGDFVAATEAMTENVEMEIVAPAEFEFVCRARGRAELLEALRQNFAKVEDQRPETLSLVAQGDALVVIAREQGRLRATGQRYDVHWVQLYQFRDGKVARFREIAGGSEAPRG